MQKTTSSLPASFVWQGAPPKPKPLPRTMAELKAAVAAVKHAPPTIDLCNQEFMGRLPDGILRIPSGCTIKNGRILFVGDAQVSA